MTYMLAYQKYYNQIKAFQETISDPASTIVNEEMFSDEFFKSFLTFTDIELY